MHNPEKLNELKDQIASVDAEVKARRRIIGLAIILASASLAYRLLVVGHLEQSAALFIGLPAFLAIATAFIPPAKSYTGTAMKSITIFLCLSGILLGEGTICILMAAPIFYAVGLVYGLLCDFRRKRDEKKNGKKDQLLPALIVVLFLPMSVEGVRPETSFDREELIVVEHVVFADNATVESNLAKPLRVTTALPRYLQMGFPKPVMALGSGLNVGDGRVVHFAGGEGAPGDLAVRIVERGEGHVKLVCVTDTSHVAHWLDWESVNIYWHPMQAQQTHVRVEIRYRRLLDPAWYFRPWERYAVKLTGEYLIQSNVGPEPGIDHAGR